VGGADALWTLHGLEALTDEEVLAALKDENAGVREQALRLAEERLGASAPLRSAVAALADDPSPQVRFQLAFTLGEADAPELVEALAKVLRRDVNDSWTQHAALSSASRSAPGLLAAVSRDKDFARDASAAHLQLLTRLASLVGSRATDADLAKALGVLTEQGGGAWQAAVLDGLGQGLQNSGRPLARLWEHPPAVLKNAAAQARPFFQRAAAAARDGSRAVAERAAATRLLGHAPFDVAEAPLRELLVPQVPAEVQLAAVRSLALHAGPAISETLLAPWSSYSPAVRRE